MRLSFNGKAIDLNHPRVMGILNITPDSFYAGSRFQSPDGILREVEKMMVYGASIIDLGAVSSRPGARGITPKEEIDRLCPAIATIRREIPSVFLSADTYHPAVAKAAIEEGADMINDIYGGRFHPEMFSFIASQNIPYLMMHMKGDPENMQRNPEYQDVVAEISYFFKRQIDKLRAQGATQYVIDPGFGFGKTLEHNYEILQRLEEFKETGCPLAVGVSRKSMIQKALGVSPEEALNGTTVLHVIALQKGAKILRVHDVKAAVEAIKLLELMNGING